VLAALLAGGAFAYLFLVERQVDVDPRRPDPNLAELRRASRSAVQANPGTLTAGDGVPADVPGEWTGFRGSAGTARLDSSEGLFRSWPEGGPEKLWEISVGEGHAGVAIVAGRLFLVDYDREKQEDVIRCLSLADGTDIWRYSYSVSVKRNHGMSRTVPAVTGDYVIAIGPKCHVTCLRMATGELVWKKDLVADCGTTVPPWYAGQCPLIDGDTVVLAPGGDPLMMAVRLSDGEVLWRTPNPGGWNMTHSSVVRLEHATGAQFVYAASAGVIGVSAENGRTLWKTPDWRINIANIPTPVVIDSERILFTGGYNAGAMMLRVAHDDGVFSVRELFRTPAKSFGSDQQTPIFDGRHVYGVIPKGELACLDLDGNVLWRSGVDRRFGLGPYTLAGDLLYVLDDQKGSLHLIEANPREYRELAVAAVLHGHDAWAPMALVSGRLVLRDLETLLCLRVGE